jgi:hypothetical protein
MNENNKSFYPLNIFEFIHHPEYGCLDLKGLSTFGQLGESWTFKSWGVKTYIFESWTFNSPELLKYGIWFEGTVL